LDTDRKSTAQVAVIEDELRVPETLQESLDAAWLSQALLSVSNGARVRSVELTEVIKTVASKARIAVEFDSTPGVKHYYCVKAFLDHADPSLGGETTIREADFYAQVAPCLSMRVPKVTSVVIDRANQRGILVMEDMVAAGCRFLTALDDCDAAFAATTLDQLARLHAAQHLLEARPWISRRLDYVVNNPYLSAEQLNELFARPGRQVGLSANARDGALLLSAMAKLAERMRARPSTLLHGDCHAGNVYLHPDGPGFTDWQMVQRGHWALDVAYHINAVLPIEASVAHERELLETYAAALLNHGGPRVDRDEAWYDYRTAVVYGFYQWAITRFTKETITETCIQRLGAAVDRHDSYRLLGVL
jgi:hypothetical protein